MIQMKRYLDNNQPSDEKSKKLRSTCDDRRIIRGLESFPNELLYEIFDYLEGCELYEAFANLNIRFQNLLISPSLRLKIKLGLYLLQYRITHIVTPNRQKIVSLSSYHPFPCDANFPPSTIDSSFSRLESLVLRKITSNELIPLLTTLLSLPRLFSLTIACTDNRLEELGNVYQIIFNLRVLKYSKLFLCSLETHIPPQIAYTKQCSNIEYLTIQHSCTLNELIVILFYTPYLRRLSCMQVYDSYGYIVNESLHTRPNLTHISIDRCRADFDKLEMFITKISPQLRILRVTCLRNAAYLDADRWERIISQHLSQLRRFKFKYLEIIDEDWESTLYHGLINRFYSSFWIKRKWIFRIGLDAHFWMGNVITYSIFPDEDKENAETSYNNIARNVEEQGTTHNELGFNNSLVVLSETHQLTVFDRWDNVINESFTDVFGPILTMVQITCLNIKRQKIFIGTLINFFKYLPNLHSLVVSSLEMMYPRCLSVEEVTTFRVIANNNKTTKVSLQQMNDLARVQFLLDLCPRVEYLEVDCTNGILLKTCVRFILMKSLKYIPNLFSTCLKIPQIEENIVEELKRMIDLEQLRHNYTIKQIDNRIYLQWN